MTSFPHTGFPLWVQRELDRPAPPGQRHAQIVRIARGLSNSGFDSESIFSELRPRYGSDVPDGEIRSIVHWACAHSKSRPHRAGTFERNSHHSFSNRSNQYPIEKPEQAMCRALSGFSADESDLFEASPVRLFNDWRNDCPLFLSAIFQPGERINIVKDFSVTGEKARPSGIGETRTREEWLARIQTHGIPEADAGSWIRMNPVRGRGVSDDDVASFRFLLLECDEVPLPLQLSFFSKLPLPIVAIISSGGRSLHAWVQVNASNLKEFRQHAVDIFDRLSPFGIDPANKNPSRLARLPGVLRSIGGSKDPRQRLLYLAPETVAFESILSL
jgi:hypothetical protein